MRMRRACTTARWRCAPRTKVVVVQHPRESDNAIGTAWMVEHRLVHRLACHHCGHVMPPPRLCPECEDEDSLVACGPGVERVADEIAQRFPEARVAIVTSDTLWSPAKAAEFVDNVEGGLVDIIIGTQLVTKGYHFPELTLVGVVLGGLVWRSGRLGPSIVAHGVFNLCSLLVLWGVSSPLLAG